MATSLFDSPLPVSALAGSGNGSVSGSRSPRWRASTEFEAQTPQFTPFSTSVRLFEALSWSLLASPVVLSLAPLSGSSGPLSSSNGSVAERIESLRLVPTAVATSRSNRSMAFGSVELPKLSMVSRGSSLPVPSSSPSLWLSSTTQKAVSFVSLSSSASFASPLCCSSNAPVSIASIP